MKKLDILSINSERIIKNDKLLVLRGGYEGSSCYCCECPGGVPTEYVWASSQSAAEDLGSDYCAEGASYSCRDEPDPAWCCH